MTLRRMNCSGCGRFMPVSEEHHEADGSRMFVFWCEECGRETTLDLPPEKAKDVT